MELNSFHTEVAPIFGSHPVCVEPGTIRHLWFDPLKTHKTPSAAKVKCTTFTLYFSQQFFKKGYSQTNNDFWSKHTLSGSTAPHTHSHKELRETLENTIPTITQLDTFCIDPGIQPPFPASRGLFCPLEALAGGKLGAPVTVEGLPCSCRCGPSGSGPEMHFLLHLVCALLTDVNQTQPKLTSLWIITHHSQQDGSRLHF